MSIKPIYLILFVSLISFSCATYKPIPSYSYNTEEAPSLTESLFKTDQMVISQEAVETILKSKIVIPDSSKLAILRFPDNGSSSNRIYGYGYWRSEEYLTLQQNYIDTLKHFLSTSESIGESILLPSLLTPNSPSIPILREAAVRLQAPLLLVFRVNSDLYENYRVFKSNDYKAFSTVEMVLLDVRTGVIPFTSITTNDFKTRKNSQDLNEDETRKRVVSTATIKSMAEAAGKLITFLETK